MAQQLRTLVPLPDSTESIPNTHVATPSSLWFQGLSGYCVSIYSLARDQNPTSAFSFSHCFWLYKMLEYSRISYHFEVFPDLLTGYLISCKMFNCSGSASSSVICGTVSVRSASCIRCRTRKEAMVWSHEPGTPFTTGAFSLVWELRLPSWCCCSSDV